ncbi:MAG: DNA-directed RNA polymerase subunit alpha, partial [Kiritimatiellota bacterium]|nr:DNA-directed RNA polymerase subunit alpha [Kiritimatiellota bacterium]
GRFEMPKRVVKDERAATSTYAKFMVEPLESGYGHTMGNSLRRVLLSSLEGSSISAVKIEGAFHEFCAVPGVVEDVTDVILNLKKVLLKMYCREPRKVRIKVKGPGEVTAANIETDQFVEVVNPAHYICTLAEDGKFEAELEISLGRGYIPADWKEKKEQEIGVIPIDCIYSPVQRVNYAVENVRVGRRTDYEKLIMEIWTDERITPDEAMIRSAAILRHHLDVFVNYDEDLIEFEQSEKTVDIDREGMRKKLNMSVNEIELSVRAANCLNNANILTVGELAMKTEADMLKFRNFGKKSLLEIEEKLREMGLVMGMQIDADLLAPRPAAPAPNSAATKKE